MKIIDHNAIMLVAMRAAEAALMRGEGNRGAKDAALAIVESAKAAETSILGEDDEPGTVTYRIIVDKQ